ncbi:MAG: TIR domain-containing protein [Sphingomicrobium sp.]
MAKLFLSYDRDDSAKAQIIAGALEKAGHDVWWDRHIGGGAEYSLEIEQALDRADGVVVLWSTASVNSAWVRDEAGAGRDRGCLIPVSIDTVKPPLGFRQFQSIDLTKWRANRKSDQFEALDRAAAGLSTKTAGKPDPLRALNPRRSRIAGLKWLAIAAAALTIVAIGLGALRFFAASSLPVVAVTAADRTPRSRAAADDLLVKLGSLSQVGDGELVLLGSSAAGRKSDLILRVADTGGDEQPRGNLVLLDGKNNSVLWTGEFGSSLRQLADLRQQISLTAGRVLGCTFEARGQRNLRREILTQFLDACASLADIQLDDYDRPASQLRKIVQQDPDFRPAWSRLLVADITLADLAHSTAGDQAAQRQVRADLAQAKTRFPDIPEIAIAELSNIPRSNFARRIDLLEAAARRAPDNAQIAASLSSELMSIGRSADAIAAAHRAADLDALSPRMWTGYIMALAYGGRVDTARDELAQAEKVWANTGTLRDAQVAFLSRFGDPRAALKLDSEGYNTRFYLDARADPSATNTARFKAGVDEFRPKTVDFAQVAWAIQGLAEFGFVDDVYYWLGRLSDEDAARISDVLFRPALASARRDARFMPLASRIGLIRYWRSSGKWPDFCSRPGISYDCKAEATKLR